MQKLQTLQTPQPSLITLPKDVQLYIWARVIYDYFVDKYCGAFQPCRIRPVTGLFNREKKRSIMSSAMIEWSRIHPKVRQLLKEVSAQRYATSWTFDKKLFCTIHLWQPE